jgi:hypothetical protein
MVERERIDLTLKYIQSLKDSVDSILSRHESSNREQNLIVASAVAEDFFSSYQEDSEHSLADYQCRALAKLAVSIKLVDLELYDTNIAILESQRSATASLSKIYEMVRWTVFFLFWLLVSVTVFGVSIYTSYP